MTGLIELTVDPVDDCAVEILHKTVLWRILQALTISLACRVLSGQRLPESLYLREVSIGTEKGHVHSSVCIHLGRVACVSTLPNVSKGKSSESILNVIHGSHPRGVATEEEDIGRD